MLRRHVFSLYVAGLAGSHAESTVGDAGDVGQWLSRRSTYVTFICWRMLAVCDSVSAYPIGFQFPVFCSKKMSERATDDAAIAAPTLVCVS